VNRVADQLADVGPALAFLLAAVPLATLLDRLGFFAAVAGRVTDRPRGVSVLALWLLAAATTIVLNLDTTIVLLTPLYVRLARRSGADPFAIALVPLLLASLASSVLPVSNLTNLIVAERTDLSVVSLLAHLGLPSLAAIGVGWWCYARRNPTRLPAGPPGASTSDGRALRIGGVIVAGVLVGFTAGTAVGIAPWVTALVADAVLVLVVRELPWREIPVLTALGVAVLAVTVAVVVPDDALRPLLHTTGAGVLVGITALATVAANVVNNLPAVLVGARAVHHMTWGAWAWLLGVNLGAVLLPLGALANLLWVRVLRAEGVELSLRRYVWAVVPVALPALLAATAVLAVEGLVAG
jgi:arsenical pump membrane protein